MGGLSPEDFHTLDFERSARVAVEFDDPGLEERDPVTFAEKIASARRTLAILEGDELASDKEDE